MKDRDRAIIILAALNEAAFSSRTISNRNSREIR
jgi:hypothetical protein